MAWYRYTVWHTGEPYAKVRRSFRARHNREAAGKVAVYIAYLCQQRHALPEDWGYRVERMRHGADGWDVIFYEDRR